jgi:hypothetical protein
MNCPTVGADRAEPEIPGPVFGSGYRVALQHVPVLRSQHREVYFAGSDWVGGGVNLYQYTPNPR